MTGPFRPFGPTEVRGADTPASDQELAAALATARQLEALGAPTEHVTPSADFADRVMAAVALEPAPRAAGFLVPLRRDRSVRGLARSLRDAWSVTTSAWRPAGARAMALAYVLAIVLIGGSVTGIAAYGTAGAIQWLGSDHRSGPTPTTLVSPSPLTSPQPAESAEPSTEPGETEDANGGAGETSEPSDRSTLEPGSPGEDGSGGGDGAYPMAMSGDSGDGSGSSVGGSTPKPSQTPKASQTPKPSQTPSPTSSSDH